MDALASQGLSIVKVKGDGNCLFRSVSHQIYGDDRFHAIVRAKCVDYMECDAPFFSQFVEGGLSGFSLYLAAKRMNSCWGDDPEIQALSEIYARPIEIWAYDSAAGARKLRTFHETSVFKSRPAMRLSYYGGGHYDSIVSADSEASLLQTAPGVAEDLRLLMQSSQRASICESSSSSDSVSRTEGRDLESAELAAVLRESRLEVEKWGADDLQRCLALSLQVPEQMGEDKKESDKTSTKEDDFVMDEKLDTYLKESELDHLQSQLLESVVAESRRDYELTASDDRGPILKKKAEDAMEAEDDELKRVLRLSELDEEEALRLAISLSMDGNYEGGASDPTRSLEPTYDEDQRLLDEAILMSMQPSLQGEEATSFTSSSARIPAQPATAVPPSIAISLPDSEDDEDLQRAIAASLLR